MLVALQDGEIVGMTLPGSRDRYNCVVPHKLDVIDLTADSDHVVDESVVIKELRELLAPMRTACVYRLEG